MTLLPLSLKPVQLDDLSPIVDLDRRCFGGFWQQDGYAREVASPNSTLLWLAHPHHPQTAIGLGCAWAIVDECHITLMAVHPEMQSQGLGQFLLWGLLHDGHQRQLRRATLEVRTHNAPAIALYEKFGFKSAGRRPGYYPNGEDALIFWRSGLDHPQFSQELQQWQATIAEKLRSHHWQGGFPPLTPVTVKK